MASTQARFAKAAIAIIGAGPCGLTLARLLELNNIDYVVFERDANSTPTAMYQGGTLDLHANSGQQAIKEAGLFEEFEKLARWDATRFVIQDTECTLKASFGEDRNAPEIDRFQLRQLLLESIPSRKVQWGHGPGNMAALGHGRALMIQQVADRSYRVYMGLEAPETLTRTTVDVGDTEATREKLLSSTNFFRDFAPELRQCIADAEGPFRPWPLYRMPVSSLSWARVPGVTLLGDAAHVSTPFVGEGVNMAMHDSLKLSQSIKKHCSGMKSDTNEGSDELEQALTEYETEMFERAQDYISRCILSENMFFSDNAAQLLIDLITDSAEKQQEQLFMESS
ncbi:tetracycline resistance protein from transposon Tn4351/Tn4400 [Colletotrichum liriopes]|uniref:Tetracycline resistance protein from transposon Tn4351/Tn4400 n=1 Tax=Colletotrichum liriopes TaxID=708192 RepID=A0AA37GS45_9PEZI|nr:tetracycline resistance protein from transposon Tn4351/Tn4400 [Colletotrichum liriopes]